MLGPGCRLHRVCALGARHGSALFSQLGQLIAQGARADAELFGGEFATATAFAERLDNQASLVITKIIPERIRHQQCRARQRGGRRCFKQLIFSFDGRAVMHDQRALHYVVEFAHIARPWVTLQGLACGETQNWHRAVGLRRGPLQ